MLGKWLKDKIDISYLADLPAEILVVQSGIPKENLSSHVTRDDWYHLPRQRVPVPDALKFSILGWIDIEMTKIEKVNMNFRVFKCNCLYFYVMFQNNLNSSIEARDHTGVKVLQLLDYLRIVFFQDAAVIQDKFPTLVIFQLPVRKFSFILVP